MAAVMVAGTEGSNIMQLTASAVAAHNGIHNGLAASAIATLGGSILARQSEAQEAIQKHVKEDDDASSVLSSVSSSDLSSLDSEDDDNVKRPTKRRRKNVGTPETSVDERTTKRAGRKIIIKEGQSAFDVVDRKEYFESGLYSGATNSSSGKTRVKRTAKSIGRLSRPLEEIVQSFTLGLPLHHGKTLLEQERDFRLPWDILNDFDLAYLPETPEGLRYRSDALDRVGRQMKPTAYKHISQNRLVWRQKDEAEVLAICDCPVGDCGDYCLNRVMQFFCSPKLCKSGKQCTNLPFSTRPVVHDLEVFWTGNRGFGLRTNTPIKAGDFVMQYVGEIITINESYRRTIEEYKARHDYYFLDYYDAEVVDAGQMGNESRFVNHSCDPNLEVVRWKLADYDEYQIGLFALRDIAAKEELSYDYGWQAFSSVDTKAVSEAVSSAGQKEEPQKQLCLCAGPSCTGFFEKSEKVKEKKAALLNKTLKKSKVKPSLKRSESGKVKKV